MFMILKRDWEAVNVVDGKAVATTIPAGRHEIERIPNPLGFKDSFWFVLKGTTVGASEGSWRQWENGKPVSNPEHPNFGKPIDWGEFEVVIEE